MDLVGLAARRDRKQIDKLDWELRIRFWCGRLGAQVRVGASNHRVLRRSGVEEAKGIGC